MIEGEGSETGASFVVDSKGTVTSPGDHSESDTPPTESKTRYETAKGIADRLLTRKINELHRKAPRPKDIEGLPPHEQKLLLADALRSKGFAPEDYKDEKGDPRDIELTGGLSITTEDGREVIITRLVRQDDKDDKGDIIYTCKDPDDPTRTIQVSGRELYASQLASEAAAIAENFPKGTQRELVTWHAQGGKDNPPLDASQIQELDDDIKAHEAEEKDPINIRDRVIQKAIVDIGMEINNLTAKNEKVPEKTTRFLSQLEIANGLKDSSISNLAALGALRNLEARGISEVADILPTVELEALKEADLIKPDLVKAGITSEELELIQKEGLSAIVGSETLIGKFAKIENLNDILGPNMTETQLLEILEASLPDEQKALLEKLKSSGKIGGGILLAILLGVIAIPIALAVEAAPSLAGNR